MKIRKPLRKSIYPIIAVNNYDGFYSEEECGTEVYLRKGIIIKWTPFDKFMLYCLTCGNEAVNKYKQKEDK